MCYALLRTCPNSAEVQNMLQPIIVPGNDSLRVESSSLHTRYKLVISFSQVHLRYIYRVVQRGTCELDKSMLRLC